jgi:hypothetical protein
MSIYEIPRKLMAGGKIALLELPLGRLLSPSRVHVGLF